MTVTKLAGVASDASIADRLHDLDHRGQVEILTIDRGDTLRRRLRGRTNRNTEVLIALDRSERLTDGAVLVLESDRAIVVRMTDERWLRVGPRDIDAALEIGYILGNLHWRVRFEPGAILIAVEGPAEHYTSRLAHLTMQGRIRVTDHD
ncbi:MAG: urease accessory protein UreE [Hyphomicrobiales bacterium]